MLPWIPERWKTFDVIHLPSPSHHLWDLQLLIPDSHNIQKAFSDRSIRGTKGEGQKARITNDDIVQLVSVYPGPA